MTAAAIEEHRDVAEELRSRYRHFVVDEYQDVSPLQQRLLDAWLGGRDDLCVVGDPNQTIYSFTGADAVLSARLSPAAIPGADRGRLVRDYRSTPQVVELANRVLGGAGRPAAARLLGQRAAGPGRHVRRVRRRAGRGRRGRRRMPRADRGRHAGQRDRRAVPDQRAVGGVRAALSEAGVPYVLRGGERFFDRPEVRQAVLLLRGAVRSAESGDAAGRRRARTCCPRLSWSPDARPPAVPTRERWESLAALVAVAEELTAVQPEAGLGDFVAELEQRAAAQHAPTVEGVTLASLHAAKGLEWDAVFLVGLVEGTLPIQHAVTDEQVEEERRLLYVGVTRARERLALSWALSRRPAAGAVAAGARRFLHGIAPSRCRRPGRRRRPAAGRAALPDGRGPGAVQPAAGLAGGAGGGQKVPAYVVFTDATLAELAVRQPADVPALVAVPGIGQSKLDRYGEDVLAIVRGEPAPSGAGAEPIWAEGAPAAPRCNFRRVSAIALNCVARGSGRGLASLQLDRGRPYRTLPPHRRRWSAVNDLITIDGGRPSRHLDRRGRRCAALCRPVPTVKGTGLPFGTTGHRPSRVRADPSVLRRRCRRARRARVAVSWGRTRSRGPMSASRRVDQGDPPRRTPPRC